jgi:hypothetical protein
LEFVQVGNAVAVVPISAMAVVYDSRVLREVHMVRVYLLGYAVVVPNVIIDPSSADMADPSLNITPAVMVVVIGYAVLPVPSAAAASASVVYAATVTTDDCRGTNPIAVLASAMTPFTLAGSVASSVADVHAAHAGAATVTP